MGRFSVSSCRYCMFVSYVYHVAVLYTSFCMTCSSTVLNKKKVSRYTPNIVGLRAN